MDTFAVSVAVQLVDKFSGGLNAISAATSNLQMRMGKFNSFLGKFQQIASSYSNIASLGRQMESAGVAGLRAVIEPAREYAHQLNIMNMAGMKHVEIQKNIAAAWKTSAMIQTSTPTQNLAVLADIRTVIGGSAMQLEEGRALLPTIMKAQQILAAASEQSRHGQSAHNMAFSMVKAIDMRGKIHPAEFASNMDSMLRVGVATGGRVTAADYQSFYKYSRTAKNTLNDEFLFTKAPEWMLEMKSSRGGAGSAGGPGAQMSAMYKQLVQGVMNKATAGNLFNLGLLKSAVLKTTTTGTTVTATGGVVGKELFAQDPSEWVNKVFLPALYHSHPNLKGNLVGTQIAIGQILKGNQMATSGVQEMVKLAPQFKRFGEIYKKTPHLDSLYQRSKQDPNTAYKAFDSSMEGLKTAIGKNVIPFIVPGIRKLTQAINWAGGMINKHPAIGAGIGGLLAGLAVAGSAMKWIANLAAGKLALSILAPGLNILKFCGWIGLIAVAITAVIFVIDHWKDIMKVAKEGVQWLKLAFVSLLDQWPGLKDFLKATVSIIKDMKDQLPGLTDEFTKFWNSLAKNITDFAGNIGKFFGLNTASQAFNFAKFALSANKDNVDKRYNDTLKDIGITGLMGGPVIDHKKQVQNAQAVAGSSQRSVVHHTTQNFNTTVNVHGDVDRDHKKLADKISDHVAKKFRQAVTSHPLAGGTHTSYAHAGAWNG